MMDLAWSLVLAALAYVPLCLWEIRMSPQLQRMVYGFSTIENFGMTVRFGGYRPNVFLVHGLMLGMFMATSTLVAWWLWRTGSIRAFRGVTLGWICLVLAVTTVLCKSTGAVILLVVGLALLESTRWVRASILVAVLLSLAPAFGAARISGWTGRDLVVLSAKYINADRAQSLEYRAKQEDALISKAMQRPWFGWGRWGRSRVYNEDKYDISVTDSLWVIALGVSGLTGLISLGGVLLVPAAALVRRFPARTWRDPRLASAAALAVGLVLTAIDCLFNAMMTPIYPAIAGALVTFSRARLRPRSRPRPPGVEPPTRPIEPGVENHAS
jgi:O-antigen ligase